MEALEGILLDREGNPIHTGSETRRERFRATLPVIGGIISIALVLVAGLMLFGTLFAIFAGIWLVFSLIGFVARLLGLRERSAPTSHIRHYTFRR